MSTIDLNLKSYDELIFEITTLNTNNYLLQQKVEQLEKENDDLKNRLDNEVAENTLRLKEVEQLENIRKEAIKYIENNSYFESNIVKTMVLGDYSSGLLNILNKGSNKE